MRRGSTPTLKIQVDLSLDDYNDIWLMLNQGVNTLTLKKERIKQCDGYITTELTQEETLTFTPGNIQVQLKALKKNKVSVSNVILLPITDVIDGGVMK